MNPEPVPGNDAPYDAVLQPAKHRDFSGCFAWSVAAFVALVFIGVTLPVLNTHATIGPQTRALAQAKQIYLALRLFAEDHNGEYPRRGVPAEMTGAPVDSNTAFACLFPTYTRAEVIFGNKFSAYQTAPPDNVIDIPYTGRPKETLQPGENVYGYTMGLTTGDNPSTPVVMDGTDGTCHYRSDRRQRGGVWEGNRAVVIRLDGSGGVETLVGPADARYVPGRPDSTPAATPAAANLLDFSHFGRSVTLLDPATGPRQR